jgi:hypothetical protein
MKVNNQFQAYVALTPRENAPTADYISLSHDSEREYGLSNYCHGIRWRVLVEVDTPRLYSNLGSQQARVLVLPVCIYHFTEKKNLVI